jgi:Zn-dependent protease with chaperone function
VRRGNLSISVTYRDQLNHRFGQAIRDAVLKDVSQDRSTGRRMDRSIGRTMGPGKLRRSVMLLSLLIVSTPFCVAALGLALIAVHHETVVAIGAGVLLVAVGYYLRTPKHKNTKATLRRPDAPKVFGVLDDICAQLNAPRIDGIHVLAEVNAYMAEYSKTERILGIGAPLWLALEPAERVALLAHEIGHLINHDPARGRLSYAALGTLARWHDLSHPPMLIDGATNSRFYFEDRGLIDRVFGFLYGTAIAALSRGFETLMFADSQRAEYLADLAAASVAGTAAKTELLRKLILSPLAEDALTQTYFDGSKHIAVFDKMARAIADPIPEKANALNAEAMMSLHRIDSTHPPTRYRLDVVAAAGHPAPALDAAQMDWAGMDQELSAFFQRMERALLSQIIVQ